MRVFWLMLLLLGAAAGASAFDVSKCVTADACYQYCENAIREYRNYTQYLTIDYQNRTTNAVEQMLLQERSLFQARMMFMFACASAAGLALGAFIVMILFKNFSPTKVEIEGDGNG